jgi:poly(A) polymerase
MAPRILTRPEHTVSRKGIDPDALKVLYRLKRHGFVAHLVGGGVRDLLLGRRPKDFDVGTSAHPQQVKRLFRNCFIVGRRFRLCHVRFGRHVVEVSTFRRQAPESDSSGPIRRDNTFGTPEEDAFRRDFTVNALFYDIATFSVIDHVGGLQDLDARVIRAIGDPGVRFQEDPVRMLRAVGLAARLDFSIERDTLEAIRALRSEIVQSSPPRILEELYKVLRHGTARVAFERLHEVGLLAYLLPVADAAIARSETALLESLGRLDEYRSLGLASPGDLANALLLGTVFVPLRVPLRSLPIRLQPWLEEAGAEPGDDVPGELAALGEAEAGHGGEATQADLPIELPLARRDLDRLRLVLAAQRRLRQVQRPPSTKRALASRAYFEDAVRWMEIHGGLEGRELAIHWRSLEAATETRTKEDEAPALPEPTRRRRRRRPRRRPQRRPGGAAKQVR